MARSVNKVLLMGRLGKDAETRFTPSGTSITSFSLATNRRSKDQQSGDWKEETDWHNIVVFQADNVAPYLLKGKQVFVEGRLQSRSYEDKDGNKRYVTEVVANAQDIVLVSAGRGEGEGGGDDAGYSAPAARSPISMPRSAQPARGAASKPAPAPQDFEPGITDDDVPF